MVYVELFMLGRRLSREKSIGIICGIIFMGIMLGMFYSLLLGVSVGVGGSFLILLFIGKYNCYWIMTSQGVLVFNNKNIYNALITTIQTFWKGHQSLKMIYYYDIRSIDIILEDDYLQSLLIKTNDQQILLKINQKNYNQDLINSFRYFVMKGVQVNHLECLHDISEQVRKNI